MRISTTELIVSVDKYHRMCESEADRRATCSRAYYAIYEEGKLFHDGLPVPGTVKTNSRGGMHQDLYERLQNPGIKMDHPDYLKSVSIGALMETLHGKRIRSDYHLDKRVSIPDANDSVAGCKRMIARLAASQPVIVSDDPPRKGGRPTLTVIK